MNIKVVLTVLLSFVVSAAIAQPANDNCQFAQVITIPPSGTICINGTNANATPDGISNVCNAPTGGNEVWYTFVALGNNSLITVTPLGATPAQSIVISVPNGNCNSAVNLVCQAAVNPNDPVTINPLALATQQIWFEVSSLTADGDFEICITSVSPPAGSAGDSCHLAVPICNKNSFTYMGPTYNSSGLVPSCWPNVGPPTGNVNHDMWFKFTVGKPGALVWRATPLAATEFEWALYDITAGCPGVELVCNYVFGGAFDPFGMDSSSMGCLFDQYCLPINVTFGSTYAIMIDDFTGLGSALGFDFEWGGSFGMLPTACFTVDNPIGCGSVTTTFSDSSGVSPFAVYQWDFGNGNTSNSKIPPAQTYSTAGNYIVTLSVSDTTGCTSIFTQEVTVTNYIPGQLDADTLLCSGINDTVTYAAGPNDSLSWNFGTATVLSGAGAGPYIIQWPITGAQTITLNIVDTSTNCTATVVKNINVGGGVNASLMMANSACVGDQINLTYTGQAADTLIWNFGNANIVSGSANGPYVLSWPIAGNDTVFVSAQIAGCSASIASVPIVINPLPASTFSVPANGCTGDALAIAYTGGASIAATYNWNFGSGVINSGAGQGPYSVTFNSAGTQNISLSVSESGCNSLVTLDSIIINQTPTSLFTADTLIICDVQSANFTYTGNASAGATYNWNFDGGFILNGSGQGPYEVNWATSGIKNVTLYVEENGCFSDSTTVSIDVGVLPVVNASPDLSLCTGDTMLIGIPGNPLYNYVWSPVLGLDDPGIAQPNINFNSIPVNPFVQEYILVVELGNCFIRDSVVVSVTERPTSNFTVDTVFVCDMDPVILTYTGNGTATSTYHWDFDGGVVNSGTGQGPYNVNWNTAGIKDVMLWVEESVCASDTTIISIDVANTPIANAGADQTFCSEDTINIGSAGLPGLSYDWSPSIGLSDDTIANPDLTFNNTTANDLSLTYLLTVSERHCIDTNSVSITVKAVQQAQILPVNGQCINGNSFDFTSAGVSVTGASFNWDFGPNANPASSSAENPTGITFNAVGSQLITLNTNTPGCRMDEDTFTVFVYPMPAPGFVTDKEVGCPPMVVQFTDTSITSANSTYIWNFGSAGISTQMNPRITFNESGFYDVAVAVTSQNNCTSVILFSDVIEVLDKPQGTLFADPLNPLIVDPVVNFSYNSSDPVQCFYQFGDGAASADCEPEHIYSDVGTYLVQLIVTNNLGCADTLYEVINVTAFYALYVPGAFTPNSDNRNDIFLPAGYGISEYDLQVFDRWGQLVFETDNQFIGWNGDYNNDSNEAPTGVYVYKIFTRDDQGKKHNKVGTVTLMR